MALDSTIASTSMSSKRRTGRPLYISHFLSTWNSRAFEFGSVLFLASIYPGSLLPMSIYALCRALSAICLSGFIGRYIDTEGRLKVVVVSILSQRVAVAASCLLFAILIHWSQSFSTTVKNLIFLFTVILACVEKLGSMMNTVAIERDWVVVIADGDKTTLKHLNTQMRQIDLLCKLAAPLAVALLDSWSSLIAVLVMFVINIVSVCIEYPTIVWVYRKEPILAQTRDLPSTEPDSDVEVGDIAIPDKQSLRYCFRSATGDLRSYWRSSAFLPSLALSLLYLTVLSFSGQMTTFLLALSHPQFTSANIGVMRTVSAAFEISATFIAPRVMASIGPVRSGIWFLSIQSLCLTPAVAILWQSTTTSATSSSVSFLLRGGSPVSTATPQAGTTIYTFIILIILSRVGLWSFDLCAQLLIQESIHPSQRGNFSATEASLQNLFEMCAFATTIAFPRTEQFRYPALISLVALYLAAGLYACHVRRSRGHLIHVPPCLKINSRYQALSGEDEGEELAEQRRSDANAHHHP